MASELGELLRVTEEEKIGVLKHFGLSESEFDENVKIIKEWLQKNSHLPKENDENKIRLALVNSKMSLEKAKQCLEGYYRVRRLYSDFFEKMMPNTEEYKKSRALVQTVVMPKLTKDLCRITIFKHRDLQNEAEDALVYELITLMIAEIRFFNDIYLSNIIICDMENYGIKTFFKYTPSVNQKLVNILMAVNLRIKEIHIINTPSFMERILAVMKSILPAKIVAKIHFHTSYETLTNFIDKKSLPSNYGGEEKSIEELYDDWCNVIDKLEPIFQRLQNVKSTEEIQRNSHDFEVFGMGSEGSFKKLAVD